MTDSPPLCKCEKTAVRLWKNADGQTVLHKQCLLCGRRVGSAIRKDSIRHPVPLADPELERIYAEKWNDWRAARDAERRAQHDDWQARYSAYLETPQWREKRRMVLEREGYLCQGCLKNRATVAHHLTYEHVFNELLFELAALCHSCHEACHADKQAPHHDEPL